MSSGFITETEIEEAKRIRQEEWDRVRNSDDPKEAPEPQIDHRSLYDRLSEQKQKKDLEYEETHKLKNMIRGLDDDEAQFLDFVDKTRLEAEKRQKLEEKLELEEFRKKSSSSQVDKMELLSAELKVKQKPKVQANRLSQKKILAGVVKKRSVSESNDNEATSKVEETPEKKQKLSNTGLRCIGVLPGIGNYDKETSSDDSSDPETPTRYDLVGKKIVKEKECNE